jgi:hypothetical protein
MCLRLDIIKVDLKEREWRMWIGFNCLRSEVLTAEVSSLLEVYFNTEDEGETFL